MIDIGSGETTLKTFEHVFKAMGQGIRLKILILLAERVFCVCELEEILGMTQPAISQHLRILKEAELVEEAKIGQWSFYILNKTRLKKVMDDWKQYLETSLETKVGMEKEIAKAKFLIENPKAPCRPPAR